MNEKSATSETTEQPKAATEKIEGVSEKIEGVSEKIEGVSEKIEGVSEKSAGLMKKGVVMQPVTSSNIEGVGHSPGPEGRPGNLYVDFKSGTRYVYADVPAEEFAALLAADSPGQYHARRIKGVYGFHKAEKQL